MSNPSTSTPAGPPDPAEPQTIDWWEGPRVTGPGLRLALTAGAWLAAAVVVALCAARPEHRDGVRVLLYLFSILLVWFLLARTRTVSWRSVAALFALGVPWAFAVGAGTHRLAEWSAGGIGLSDAVQYLGPTVAIGGIGEEGLKLVPLLLVVLLAPGRARRFAVVDWLLLGLASGLAFQAAEELARRVYVNVGGPDLMPEVLVTTTRSGLPEYGWGLLSGGSAPPVADASWPGHHVTTALTAVAVGLAVAAWRHAVRGRARIFRRVVAVLAPVAVWWATVCVHAGYNATAVTHDEWLEVDDPAVPAAIRWGWQLTNRGHGLGWVLLLLLLVALLVDARRLRTAHDVAPDPSPGPFAPAEATDRWTTAVTGRVPLPGPLAALRGVLAAGCALAAYVRRDLAVLVVAHARDGDEPRGAALARGRAAAAMLRSTRADATAAVSPDSPAARRAWRLGAAATGVVLLATTGWLALGVSGRMGNTIVAWLAGILDVLGPWWAGLGTGERTAIVAGVVAVVTLSAAAPAAGDGVSGVAARLLGGTRATGGTAAATPQQLLADAAGSLLTFAPASARPGGVAAAREVRAAVDGFAARRTAR